VTTIENCAFNHCSGLALLQIPSSVTTIGLLAFEDCASLTQLQIPSSITEVSHCAFQGVTKLERLTLVGSVLSRAVVTALEKCLTSTAKVVGADLVTRKFGPFEYGYGIFDRFTLGGGKFGRFPIVRA
jgi:hypothetical protein